MASFISQSRKHELEQYKVLANICYSGGIIASMSLSKKRPRFDEVFKFPDEGADNIERSKAEMIIWAEQVNREARRRSKEGN